MKWKHSMIPGGTGRLSRACRRGMTLLVLSLFASDGPVLTGVAAAAELSTLKAVPVPRPADLGEFIADEGAAVRLGKALFWDMQVGSDGKSACATCHFHAGADSRSANSVSPGLSGGDTAFTISPNGRLKISDFPFTRFTDPHDRFSSRFHTNDVVSSQGVTLTRFQEGRKGSAVDGGRSLRDTLFARNGRNLRRVAPRNAPTVINAVFNFNNFWDGRANHFFNGVNPFGIQDRNASILVSANGTIEPLELNKVTDPVTGARSHLLDNSGLASQAVGPPLSDFEMSWRDRSFPEIGRKLLSLRPLGGQVVHRNDSVLGSLSRSPASGLATTYAEMIKAAFPAKYWNSDQTVVLRKGAAQRVLPSRQEPREYLLDSGRATVKRAGAKLTAAEAASGFTLMEANFAFFFGLAIQMYEATLVSDDTPFDRFVAGDPNAMTLRQQRGMSIFFSGGAACVNCHVGPEFTAASVSNARNPLEPGLIELMAVGDGNQANYDIGFYNIGVTPIPEDIGRGGSDPFGFPLSFSRQNQLNPPPPFSFPKPGCVNDFIGDPPNICPQNGVSVGRIAVDGSFKTPGLRNVELTGPYFHNGSALTLRQVVDFYIRGGNFHEENIATLDPFVTGINGLKGAGKEDDRNAVVDFLLALTDERVRQEMAPFDHPQLLVPNGHSAKVSGDPRRNRVLDDEMLEIPAVGAAGRRAQGLPPLRPFLDSTGDPDFHFRP